MHPPDYGASLRSAAGDAGVQLCIQLCIQLYSDNDKVAGNGENDKVAANGKVAEILLHPLRRRQPSGARLRSPGDA